MPCCLRSMEVDAMQSSKLSLVVDRADGQISIAEAIAFVSSAEFGAVDIFVGHVRNVNLGRDVDGISYDMFDALALVKFNEAADKAAAHIGVPCSIYIAHAKGRLTIGDIAVVVAVGTGHRAAAFEACRLVIESVKHEAPIWKQEHYSDGDSVWSEGTSLQAASPGAPSE